MASRPEKNPIPCKPVLNPPQTGVSRMKSPKKGHQIQQPSIRFATRESSSSQSIIPENAHINVRLKPQEGSGINLLCRILAAVLYEIYTRLPLNAASRIVGMLFRIPLPRFLREPVVRTYAWIFSVKLEEAEFHNDLARYNSLSQFFRRRLVPSARPLDPVACLTSPVDGKIISCGLVKGCHLTKVKGLAYTVRALIGPHAKLDRRSEFRIRRVNTLPSRLDALSRKEADGRVESVTDARAKYSIIKGKEPLKHIYHCAIYLAPGDYHCFHSPADWEIQMRRHFPGRLFSVSSHITRWLSGIFCVNERAVYMGTWLYGCFVFVAVGATNVGSIHVYSDPDLRTNRRPSYLRHFFTDCRDVKVSGSNNPDSDTERDSVPVIDEMDGYEDLRFGQPIELTKGELFGEFNFGSTIVIVFEAPPDFQFFAKKSDRVRVGQALGNVVKADP